MHRMKLLWSLHTIINTVQASVSAIVSGLWGPDYNVKGVFLLFLLIRSMEFIWKQCSQSTMCCFSQVTLGGGHILGSLQQCKLRLPRWPGVVEGHDDKKPLGVWLWWVTDSAVYKTPYWVLARSKMLQLPRWIFSDGPVFKKMLRASDFCWVFFKWNYLLIFGTHIPASEEIPSDLSLHFCIFTLLHIKGKCTFSSVSCN